MSDPGELMQGPGQSGRYGEFGGRYVPESLVPACQELEAAFDSAWADPAFRSRLDDLLADFAGRPTPVTECTRLSERLGIRLLLKREDLAHTGSHKINNVLGQALLAERMGKRRLIVETGAGQHGVAAATAAALLGLECVVYMGAVDVERQALNVFRMELLGAQVRPVESGSRTLKDAINEALRDWVASVETTHYCIGSVVGPHPFPYIVRELQRVVGDEARAQCHELLSGRDPDFVVACVGGGSNAAGTFGGFVDTASHLVGVEAAGGAALNKRRPGSRARMRSRSSQDEEGQILEAHLDLSRPRLPRGRPRACPSRRRRESGLSLGGRRGGARSLPHWAESEGIIPALEPAHALAFVMREAGRSIPHGSTVLGDAVGPGRQGRGARKRAHAVTTATGRVPGALEAALRKARDAGHKPLVPYVTGGLGRDWLDVVRALGDAGADAIEIGIPFLDPVMDGPVIQRGLFGGARVRRHPVGDHRGLWPGPTWACRSR